MAETDPSRTNDSDPVSDQDTPAGRPVLVVDDEQSMREFLEIMLDKKDLPVATEERGEDAIQRLEDGERFRLVITDLKMPGADGLDVLDRVKQLDPACQVIVVTAYATPESAIEAMKQGAYDYLQKPFKLDEVNVVVERALEKFDLLSENLYLKQRLEARGRFGEIVGRSEPMQEVYDLIDRVAPTPSTVLITGESGTGKELVARAIHRNSEYADGPFRPISCGAIPDNLIESELFGHVQGAFTGADRDKDGLFRSAEGGTVLLDEVGELPLSTQVKLLRALQEKRVKPVGGDREIDVDCRILAATNRDLEQLIDDGDFREDLYYRLNVIRIRVPPLRQRREDIPLLIEYFIDKYASQMDANIQGVDSDAKQMLLDYDYPGNVRELENIIQRAVTLERQEMISTDVLPFEIQEDSFEQITETLDVPAEGNIDLDGMVERLEKTLIDKALDRTDGVKKQAADKLGISFRSLRYRLEKFDDDDGEPDSSADADEPSDQ
jgi:two-component system response regulator PilR (NtrC family)